MFNLRQGIRTASVNAARHFSSTVARADVAKLTLVGRVGTDISELSSQAGRKYVKYALAVNTSKDHTSWFNVAVFDENAINFMTNYVQKGYVKFMFNHYNCICVIVPVILTDCNFFSI